MVEGTVYVDENNQVIGQAPTTTSPYVPMGAMQRNDKADLLEKIRPDLYVEFMRHKLLGERWDEQTQKWIAIPALQKDALSEEGAEQIANLMLAPSSPSTSISSLNDREIKRRAYELTRTAILMCVENYVLYKMKHQTQFNFVREVVFTNALVVLKQPENEGIRRLIAGTIQETRHFDNKPDERGGLRSLFSRKKP